MVNQQESSEQHRQHTQHVQNQVERVHTGPEDDHRKGKGHFEGRRVVAESLRMNDPYEVVVEQIGVGCSDAQIEHHHQEEALIGVADATGGKDAMMVSLQNARVADVAMPRTRRTQCFAGGTKTPQFEVRGIRWRSKMSAFYAGVGQDESQLIGDDIQEYEAANSCMKAKVYEMGLEWVDGGQDYEQLEIEYHWRSDEEDQ